MLILFFTFCWFCTSFGFVQSYDERCLQDKIAVVTGAAQGIGYAIADNFLNNGVKTVIILDYQFIKGFEAAATLNNKYGENRAVFMYCDVTEDLAPISFRILEEYDYIDIFVNDAGIINEYCPEITIRTNALAPIEWSLTFSNHMRRDRGGRGGTIINLSSVAGYYIQPFSPVYSASKYAVIGFTKSLGHPFTYRDTGVRVIALCPGFTYTALTRQDMVTSEQLEAFQRFKGSLEWQTTDEVGKRAVEVFEIADSGTAWSIIGGKEPVEAPVSVNISVEYLDSLP